MALWQVGVCRCGAAAGCFESARKLPPAASQPFIEYCAGDARTGRHRFMGESRIRALQPKIDRQKGMLCLDGGLPRIGRQRASMRAPSSRF
jgi:hypothetical protein